MRKAPKKNINIIRINNIEKIQLLKQTLIQNQVATEDEIAVITAKIPDDDALSANVLDSIIKNETIPHHIKYVICTSILDTGINILNENISLFALHNPYVGFEADAIQQFISRFRNAKNLKLQYFISQIAAQKEPQKLAQLTEKTEQLFDDKLRLYQQQLKELIDLPLNEGLSRSALVNLNPAFDYDSKAGQWYVRNSFIGYECVRFFNKSLTLDTFVQHLNKEYRSVKDFNIVPFQEKMTDWKKPQIKKIMLPAIAKIGEMLKNQETRHFLFAKGLEDNQFRILEELKKIDYPFDYADYEQNIKDTPEFLEWKQTHKQTLKDGNYPVRLHHFLTFLNLTGLIKESAEWTVQHYHDTAFYRQKAKLYFTAHGHIKRKKWNIGVPFHPVYEKERQVYAQVIEAAQAFIGQKTRSVELTRQVLERVKGSGNLFAQELTERKVSDILRIGYLFDKVTIKGYEYLTLKREINLEDLVGSELGRTEIHIRGCLSRQQLVKSNKESDKASPPESNQIPEPPLIKEPKKAFFGPKHSSVKVPVRDYKPWEPEFLDE